jgi:hypothetical protein
VQPYALCRLPPIITSPPQAKWWPVRRTEVIPTPMRVPWRARTLISSPRFPLILLFPLRSGAWL